jgi:hypothetical protein
MVDARDRRVARVMRRRPRGGYVGRRTCWPSYILEGYGAFDFLAGEDGLVMPADEDTDVAMAVGRHGYAPSAGTDGRDPGMHSFELKQHDRRAERNKSFRDGLGRRPVSMQADFDILATKNAVADGDYGQGTATEGAPCELCRDHGLHTQLGSRPPNINRDHWPAPNYMSWQFSTRSLDAK